MSLEVLYRATHTPTKERAPNCTDFRKTIHKVFSECGALQWPSNYVTSVVACFHDKQMVIFLAILKGLTLLLSSSLSDF